MQANSQEYFIDSKSLVYNGNTSAKTSFWNRGSFSQSTEGWNLDFWGRGIGPTPDSCRQTDGFVTTEVPINTSRTTGLVTNEIFSKRYMPRCSADIPWQGLSHFHVNKNKKHGGIGLYTHTGPFSETNKHPSFFQPYDIGGQSGSGANQYIQGLYASINPQWIFQPWSAQIITPDRLRVAIIVEQKVELAELHSNSQLQQIFDIVVINKHCHAKYISSSKKCQISFNLKTFLKGIHSDSNIATLLYDPEQGGLPVVLSKIPEASHSSYFNDGSSAFTSWGQSTQKNPTDNLLKYQVEISWDQLLNVQRIIASKVLDKQKASITSNDLDVVFGPKHSEPAQWAMTSFRVAQEVYNPDLTKKAVIGGHFKSIKLLSVGN